MQLKTMMEKDEAFCGEINLSCPKSVSCREGTTTQIDALRITSNFALH
jgi:hypothetical protein